jgi:transposase
MSYREIQDELGVSAQTISKALNRPEAFVEGYQRKKAVERRALGKFEERIQELLTGKEWARKCKGRRPRRTARWVYRQIKSEGYEGAESTVRTYVRNHFKLPKPACPIEHFAADEVQFDFGFIRVKIGADVVLVAFVGAVFCYSTRRFLFAYPAERQECLFDAIERTYQRAGGITNRSTLDNTPLAVKKVLEGRNRIETEEYARFRTLLGVNPRFTNRGAGWEKGHVEGTVGWGKRQVLLDLEVKDWAELQKVLDEECEKDARERRHGESGKLVQELFEEECGILRPFPYEGRRSYRRVRAEVSRGGLVHVEGCRYSAPISLRGRRVRVRLYWDEVVLTFNQEEVARWPRDWGKRGEHYNVEHYLALLKRAPALLDHGKPFTRMPAWLHQTREALQDDKSFVKLLLAADRGKYTFEELERACVAALESRCVTFCVIEQKALTGRGTSVEDIPALDEEDCGGFGKYRFAIESPEMYDEIIEGAQKKDVA